MSSNETGSNQKNMTSSSTTPENQNIQSEATLLSNRADHLQRHSRALSNQLQNELNELKRRRKLMQEAFKKFQQ